MYASDNNKDDLALKGTVHNQGLSKSFHYYLIYRSGMIESKKGQMLKVARSPNGHSHVVLKINGTAKKYNKAVLVYSAFSAISFDSEKFSIQY